MIDNSKEYVICAAIWYKDDTEAPKGAIAQNINNGVVIGQYRHNNCINVRASNPLWNAKKLSERLGGNPLKITKYGDTLEFFDYVDGFLTSDGRFVDRWQAMEIAYKAGQVSESIAVFKGYMGKKYSSDEFQNQEPHHRTSSENGNGWKMLCSEDLY